MCVLQNTVALEKVNDFSGFWVAAARCEIINRKLMELWFLNWSFVSFWFLCLLSFDFEDIQIKIKNENFEYFVNDASDFFEMRNECERQKIAIYIRITIY